jgi:hypothetical protein
MCKNGQASTVEGDCYLWSPCVAKRRDTGCLLPGNAAVNMYPQQWDTVFSVGSVQRSYLKNKRRYSSVDWSEVKWREVNWSEVKWSSWLVNDRVLSSEFSAGDSHGKFGDLWIFKCDLKTLCVLQCTVDRSVWFSKTVTAPVLYKPVKISADRMKRLMWSDCTLCKAATVL